MKLLVTGCIHGDSKVAQKLAKRAKNEDVDAIIVAGDFTAPGEKAEGIMGELLKAGKRIMLLPGNHESLATAEFLSEKYNLISLHNRYYKLGELGIAGCGSANIGIFQLGEDEIYNILKSNLDKMEAEKKMIVTHVHPHDTLVSKMSGWDGSTGLKAVIDALQPDLAVSSHIHETEGLEDTIGKTKHHSVGKNGTIIEV